MEYLLLILVSFIAGHYFPEFFKHYFKKSEFILKDKREAAKTITKYVDKGVNNRYRIKLSEKQQDKAEEASSQARVYDKKIDSEFRLFLGLWKFINTNYNVEIPGFKKGEHLKKNIWLFTYTDEKAEYLRKRVKQWLK